MRSWAINARARSGARFVVPLEMSERIIVRDAGGRWLVLASESGPFVLSHERRDDALAHATTGLRQVGGGLWIMKDVSGRELARGEVSSHSDASAAIR